MKTAKQWIKAAVMVLAMATVATGCDKGDDRDGPRVLPETLNNQTMAFQVVAPNGTCPGCLQQPEFIFAGLGKARVGDGTSHRFELALDIYGELALGANRANAAAACQYTGPVVGIGNFHIIDNTDPRLCGALPGKYQVITSKQTPYSRGEGAASAGIIQDMTLIGKHQQTGRTVEIDLRGVQISGTCDIIDTDAVGIDGAFRFSLQGNIVDSLVIKAVNGQPCYNGVSGNGFWIE